MSIFVLSIAVVGIFNAFSIVTILTSDSSDRLVAAYLAQEGMEIVRNIRDTNWLNMDTCISETCLYHWDDGLNLSSCSSTGCEADYNSTVLSGSFGSYLRIDPFKFDSAGSGFYNYDVMGSETKFKRKIKVSQVADADITDEEALDHIIDVIVEVTWDKKATLLNSKGAAGDCGPYNCITTEEVLYNWYNYLPAI